MKAIEIKAEKCACNGQCTGYASRRDCPPLIVLAIAAAAAMAIDPAQ